MEETGEYADENWILLENLHVSHLKDSCIIIYNLTDDSSVVKVGGWKIIKMPLKIDKYRTAGSKNDYYTGLWH